MSVFMQWAAARRAWLLALPVPLALSLAPLFPITTSAHTILLRSDPPKDAQLALE